MGNRFVLVAGLSSLVIVVACQLAAGQATPSGSVTIHNPWITNDRVADCRSLQTIGATFKNAYSPTGVTAPADDQTIAINCYNNHKRRFYHWGNIPPDGPNGVLLNDPVYGINVFGWGLCFNHGPQGATIARAAGLDGRRIDLVYAGSSEHTFYEAYYAVTGRPAQWHALDTMTTMYVMDWGTPPQIASCEDMKNDQSLLMLAPYGDRACPGFLLCGDTPTWFASEIHYWQASDGIVTNNWSMNMDLHTGESFQRSWQSLSNQFPPKSGGSSDPPFHHEAQRDYKDTVNFPYWEPYTVQMSYYGGGAGPTYRRWANGTYDMQPNFRTSSYKAMLYSSSGVAMYKDDGISPDLHPAVIGVQGEAVFHIKLPLYLTDANISGKFLRTNSADIASIQVSGNGTTWTTVWNGTSLGTTTLTNFNIRSQVYGKWEYYVKIVLKAASGSISNVGVSNLDINTTFEHNKGATAYLDKGLNNLSFTFDNPQDLVAGNSRIKLTYKWKEYGTTDWTVDKIFTTYVYSSPTNFTITTGGAKVPRTEYIQMDVLPWLYGDVDASGSVDLADLKLLVGAWNSTPTSGNWNASADIDVNGSVNLGDLKTMVANWNQSL